MPKKPAETTEKDLHRQSRADLVEIIYAIQQQQQTEREQAEAENAALQAQIAALQAQLADRTLQIEQSGSIAEAAAEQYRQSVCAAEKERILAEAGTEAEALRQNTRTECDAMVAAAKAEADAKWEEFRRKVLHAAQADPGLKARLGGEA